MTAPATLASTAPVKKFGVVSVSSPPSVFSRPPAPVRTVVTVALPVVGVAATSGPPVIVAPAATVMAF